VRLVALSSTQPARPEKAGSFWEDKVLIIPPLGLDSYQTKAIQTDRSRQGGAELDLTVLGLVGEAGSLLSEVKKKQRDSRSYLGYEDAVVEEMGDMLWYLAAVSHHHGLKLSEIARLHGAQTPTFAELQPQLDLPLASPSVAFEQTLLRLTGSVGRLADFSAGGSPQDRETVLPLLSNIFDNMVRAANESGITLEKAAAKNLEKASDRWPVRRIPPPPFDANFPEDEQLPRTLEVAIFERTGANGKTYVCQKCNGLIIGDRLTDNIMLPDDFRFHDAFHFAMRPFWAGLQ
jgi:NTP pyrophosphatase (non-canonical NTP hydrolase)